MGRKPGPQDRERVVYLLHFDRPFSHAKHYMGSTDNLERRLEEHANGRGAVLMKYVREAGIGFVLARTWKGQRGRERQLKARGHADHCPVCRPEMKIIAQ